MNTNNIAEQALHLQKQNKFSAAIEQYQQLVDHYEAVNDDLNYVEYMVMIARCYEQIAYYQKENLAPNTATYMAKVIQVARQKLGDDHLSTVKAITYQATWFRNQKETNKAIHLTEEALAFYQTSFPERLELIAEIHYCQTILTSRYEDAEKTIEILTNAQVFFEKHPTRFLRYLTICYSAWGQFYMAQYPQIAIRYFDKVGELIKDKEGMEQEIANRYFRLAICYFNLNEYNFAISFFRKSLHIALNKYPNYGNIPYAYINIGNCLFQQAHFAKALYYFQEAEKEGKKKLGETDIFFAHLYSNKGNAYGERKQYDKKAECLLKVIAIYQVYNHPWLEHAYNSMGETYMMMENYEEGLKYYQKAAKTALIHKDSSYRYEKWTILRDIRLAEYFEFQNQFDKGLAKIQEAIAACQYNKTTKHIFQLLKPEENTPHTLNYLTALKWKAMLLYKQFLQQPSEHRLLQAAIFTIQVAAKLLEQTRNKYGLDESKIDLVGSNATKDFYFWACLISQEGLKQQQKDPSTFEQAVNEICQLNQEQFPTTEFNYLYTKEQLLKFAFYCTEQEKGIVLLEQLQKKQKEKNELIPKEIRDQKRELEADLQFTLNRIKKLENKLLNAPDEVHKQEIQSKILALQAENVATNEQYRLLRQQLQTDYPQQEFKQIKIQSIDSIQSALKKGQTLLSYHVSSQYQEVLVWVITHQQHELIKLVAAKAINTLVNQLLKSINQFRYAKYVKAAYQLYQYLIQPLLPQIEANRTNDLIIIPHGKLNEIPFEALLTSNVSVLPTSDYSELPYLIHQYNISYHLSASLFYGIKTEQQQKVNEEDTFVGFAPVYLNHQSPNNINDDQTSISPSVLETVGIASRSLRIGEVDYEALIYSEEEVKNVKALFEDQTNEASIYLHEQATKSNFEEVIQNKKYIHIAAHGYETQTSTDLTGIVFSPQETDQEQEDAILYLQDMSQLQLTAELVVLSSCKSGIGKLKGGEGMMAMNRGFLAAGAKNVIYTLFKIYDQSSSEFVKIFFEQVIQHQKSYREALRIAKQQLIKQQHFTPKHWAGFVLIGQ